MSISSLATDAAIAKYIMEIERMQNTIDNPDQQIDRKTPDLEENVDSLQKAKGRRTNLKKTIEIHRTTI
ncbi:hypothetical protein FS837_010448 [Tulasnella sp. UAMH 9824]|nr:hypothetical protein FS837_010448 [Tulasnella sp. UAMH 9824]